MAPLSDKQEFIDSALLQTKLDIFLQSNRNKIFGLSEASQKDYVVVLPPNKGKKTPQLFFYKTKKQLHAAVKENIICAYGWRYAHSLNLMF